MSYSGTMLLRLTHTSPCCCWTLVTNINTRNMRSTAPAPVSLSPVSLTHCYRSNSDTRFRNCGLLMGVIKMVFVILQFVTSFTKLYNGCHTASCHHYGHSSCKCINYTPCFLPRMKPWSSLISRQIINGSLLQSPVGAGTTDQCVWQHHCLFVCFSVVNMVSR